MWSNSSSIPTLIMIILKNQYLIKERAVNGQLEDKGILVIIVFLSVPIIHIVHKL